VFSNATPSGSFSSNHFSAASTFREHLDVVFVSNLLARVEVNEKRSCAGTGIQADLRRVVPIVALTKGM
jgi:hypothetical protein